MPEGPPASPRGDQRFGPKLRVAGRGASGDGTVLRGGDADQHDAGGALHIPQLRVPGGQPGGTAAGAGVLGEQPAPGVAGSAR